MEPNRLSASRPNDLAKTKLTDMFIGGPNSSNGKSFHLAQVISSKDSKNVNRIRVRIPILDDVFYLDKSGNIKESIGDDKLPICIAANSRFIETPENGSVVLVALMDSEKPYTGRIWFTALTELTSKDIFDKTNLTEELTSGDVWKNAEENMEVQFNSSPGVRGREKIKSKSKTTNYKTGIRGKDKNKLLFDKDKTTLIQNEGENGESSLELTKNAILKAKELELVSSQSPKREEPVFADPLWKFMQQHLNLTQSIINLLATSPGTVSYPGAPVVPSSMAPQLVASYAQLLAKFNQLKIKGNGASKYIKIN